MAKRKRKSQKDRTNYDLQNTTHKTNIEQRKSSQKNKSEPKCSGRVSSNDTDWLVDKILVGPCCVAFDVTDDFASKYTSILVVSDKLD